MTVEIDVAREMSATTGNDLTKEGKLADTAVLELDVTEALETLLIDIIEHAQRVPEANLFVDCDEN